MKLKLATHATAEAIELECSDPARFPELRTLGPINEQIKWKQRFFVPTDQAKGLTVLTALLKRYPVLAPKEQPAESLPIKTELDKGMAKLAVAEEWVWLPEQTMDDNLPEFGSVPEPTPQLIGLEAVPELLPFADSSTTNPPSSCLMVIDVPVARNGRRNLSPSSNRGSCSASISRHVTDRLSMQHDSCVSAGLALLNSHKSLKILKMALPKKR